MKVAVMGAGAVGGYFGGVLARFGEDVSLIEMGEHLDAIKRGGLRLSTNWGDFTVNPPATSDPAEVGPVDLILYTVKTYSSDVVLPLIRPMVGPRATILTVQNGVTSYSRIASVYGPERVLPGAAYIETGRPEPGRIRQTGSTARIEFGEIDGRITPRVREVERLFSKEGIQVRVSTDIESALWTKLVAVGAIGTVMAVTRASLPEVFAAAEGERTIRTVMEEIVAVGTAKGVRLAPDVVEGHMASAKAEMEAYQASLQQDLEAGRPLEIDDILGAAVR
ncbi:MAG: 2-dehydropantoate 2-reductase, partial [Gemmatimonadetes bacterium]|nr:2-dehydropantoate 2-reductase [Gemmatimonadota bacterium]